jgi:hypothetical protein
MVHRADSVERIHRDQPSERETGNSYEKSFEIRFDEIDFIGHLHNTMYLEYCSHTRYCHFVEQGWDLCHSRWEEVHSARRGGGALRRVARGRSSVAGIGGTISEAG